MRSYLCNPILLNNLTVPYKLEIICLPFWKDLQAEKRRAFYLLYIFGISKEWGDVLKVASFVST